MKTKKRLKNALRSILLTTFVFFILWLMGQFSHPELGNLVGLLSLLIALFTWRYFGKLPARLVDTNNKLMKESAFAFLPVSAGALMMLVHMGQKIPAFLFIMFFSTLIPLWIYAKMAKRWL